METANGNTFGENVNQPLTVWSKQLNGDVIIVTGNRKPFYNYYIFDKLVDFTQHQQLRSGLKNNGLLFISFYKEVWPDICMYNSFILTYVTKKYKVWHRSDL